MESENYVEHFRQSRENILNRLVDAIHKLEEVPAFHASVAYDIRLIASLFKLNVQGNGRRAAQREGSDVPSCFQRRCNLITSALLEQAALLEPRACLVDQCCQALYYIRLQVGRLTVEGHSNVDSYVELMESMVDSRISEIQTRRCLADEDSEALLGRIEMSFRMMNREQPGCSCNQCRKRRVAAAPEESILVCP
ncbi:uncharacterized protein N7482_005583 [Penicillium canariense]|uniref:Uncharacterized protein n=1 Tax=Penicillium canariense TaxID=189055 RepID=A0A9W9I882_9EURO|nr:uncharacterized protein N7482_005583 [Penicillium canariense]KAJ5166802.1 hypothetical protein N7482_005583 [Penicillium canariense]